MWSGARHSTHGVVDVGAYNEAFSPAVRVLDGDDVSGLLCPGRRMHRRDNR